MAKVHQNVLLVEGKNEVRLIPELMEKNGINWETENKQIVYIKDYDGYEKLVARDVIKTEFQASGLSALGIVIDADYNPSGRWQSIRTASLTAIPDLPQNLPTEGLVHTASNGIKFGIWMMPDNQTRGMLETFLAYLLPNGNDPLWQFVREATQEAKGKGAMFTDVHEDKAYIYTWLAWQNPPGRQLHQAVKECILDPKRSKGQMFVTWFKKLYGLV
jgi:hypothetical protein